MRALLYFEQLLQPAVQKVDLQVERPSLHIIVEVAQVRIIVYRFKLRYPFIMFSQHLGQGCFPCPDITGDGNVL
ncbi:hypothetical protein D3C86_1927600 [compost metagenome]